MVVSGKSTNNIIKFKDNVFLLNTNSFCPYRSRTSYYYFKQNFIWHTFYNTYRIRFSTHLIRAKSLQCLYLSQTEVYSIIFAFFHNHIHVAKILNAEVISGMTVRNFLKYIRTHALAKFVTRK